MVITFNISTLVEKLKELGVDGRDIRRIIDVCAGSHFMGFTVAAIGILAYDLALQVNTVRAEEVSKALQEYVTDVLPKIEAPKGHLYKGVEIPDYGTLKVYYEGC